MMDSAIPNLQIAEEAADWAVRLDSGPLDSVERQALAEWLRTSPVHVSELLQSYAMLAGLGDAASRSTLDLDALLAGASADVIPLHSPPVEMAHRGGVSLTMMRDGSPTKRRWAYAAALALFLGTAAGVLVVSKGGVAPDAAAPAGGITYVTAVGEQRSIGLDDGSIVSLNADSRAEIAFSSQERTIRLGRGEAMFDVAHDPARPFRVYAHGTLVQAVGTKFVVKYTQAGLSVVVLEGRVVLGAASNENATATPALFLENGQEASIDGNSRVSSVHRADLAGATSWRSRQLTFSDDSLASIAAEFNRYNRTKLEVRDGELANTRFSGVFDADDPDSFVAFLELTAGVEVDRSQTDKVVLTAH